MYAHCHVSSFKFRNILVLKLLGRCIKERLYLSPLPQFKIFRHDRTPSYLSPMIIAIISFIEDVDSTFEVKYPNQLHDIFNQSKHTLN